MFVRCFAVCLMLSITPITYADVRATTEDGQRVILRSNGTWVPAAAAEQGSGEGKAVLTLETLEPRTRVCRLGLRLQNNTPETIRSLVLRFTAYIDGNITFETVSRGFSWVRPTLSQFQEIDFRGISCDEIESVELSAARNCHVGDLTKFSATPGDCLDIVRLEPSSLLPIVKTRSNY